MHLGIRFYRSSDISFQRNREKESDVRVVPLNLIPFSDVHLILYPGWIYRGIPGGGCGCKGGHGRQDRANGDIKTGI